MQNGKVTIDLLITLGKKATSFERRDVLENLIKSLDSRTCEEKVDWLYAISVEAMKLNKINILNSLLMIIQELPKEYIWGVLDSLMDCASGIENEAVKGIIEPLLNEAILKLSTSTPDSDEIAIPDNQSTPPICDKDGNPIESIFNPSALPNLFQEKPNKEDIVCINCKRKRDKEETLTQSSPPQKQGKFTEQVLSERKNYSPSPERNCG